VISKSFLAQLQDFKENMDKELTVIGKLKHRNIIEFIDVKQTGNNFYYVFELCEG